MNKLEKILYTARTHTTGGRDGGSSRSDDGRVQIRLSQPGTSAQGANPEQLLAAGWSACFLSALHLAARKRNIALPAEAALDAEIDPGMAHGVYGLAARLNVSLPGIDNQAAAPLVESASRICPYSLATCGNIEVSYQVIES